MTSEQPLVPSDFFASRRAAVLVVLALALGAILNDLGTIRDYRASSWVVTFDAGFIRRALPGQLVVWVTGDRTLTLEAIQWSASILLSAMLAALLWIAVGALRRDAAALPAVLTLVVSPFTIRYLTMDLGRTDPLAALACILGAVVACRSRGVARAVSMVGAIVFALLVHEGALILFVPTMLAWLVVRNEIVLRDAAAVFVVATIATVLIVVASKSTAPDVAAIHERLSARAAFPVDSELAATQVRDLAGNLELVVIHRGWIGAHLDTILLAVLLTAWCWIPARKILSAVGASHGRRAAFVVVAAALSPLALATIAIDYWRWASWAAINLHVIALTVPGRWRHALPHPLLLGVLAISLWSPGPAIMDSWHNRPLAALLDSDDPPVQNEAPEVVPPRMLPDSPADRIHRSLAPQIADVYRRCCAGPVVPAEDLAAEVESYLTSIQSDAKSEEFLDPDTARQVARRCSELLDRLASTPASDDEHRAVQAAVRYFVLADDGEGDDSIVGFDDDLDVVEATARVLD